MLHGACGRGPFRLARGITSIQLTTDQPDGCNGYEHVLPRMMECVASMKMEWSFQGKLFCFKSLMSTLLHV